MARSGAASAETANSSSTRRNQLPTGPTLLRRGSDAVKPEKAPPKPKARAEKPSKDDPNHPLRGGKQRKIKFAPRPARRKGSDEWLARQIDSHQELVLRKAFEISEDPTRCLEVCRWQRQMGRLHTDCPLKMPEKEELRCTDEKCNCKPHYQQLVGKQGGMGTGKPDLVRRAPLAFSNARLSTSPRAPPLLAVCRVASCELLCSCGWVRARTRPPTHSRMRALGGADSGDGARPRVVGARQVQRLPQGGEEEEAEAGGGGGSGGGGRRRRGVRPDARGLEARAARARTSRSHTGVSGEVVSGTSNFSRICWLSSENV